MKMNGMVVLLGDLRGELALGAHRGGQRPEHGEPAPHLGDQLFEHGQEGCDGVVFGADDQPVRHAAHGAASPRRPCHRPRSAARTGPALPAADGRRWAKVLPRRGSPPKNIDCHIRDSRIRRPRASRPNGIGSHTENCSTPVSGEGFGAAR